MRTRPARPGGNTLHGLLALLLIALLGTPLARAADQPKIQLMFVQTAEDFKADDKTLRLVKVGVQTLYFTDRPVRQAGHISMQNYLKEWTAAAGPENFAKDPPNATLSVYEDGNPQSTLVVVELLAPEVEGKDMVYHYRLIEGEMPDSGGRTAVFIDWIGPGGGVGPGFHGVGVGRRGVGVR